MSMFNGIKLRTLLSTPEEWHCLLIGFFEVLCPWAPMVRIPKAQEAKILKEYHYYMGGRGAGFVALVFALLGIAKIILEVLL